MLLTLLFYIFVIPICAILLLHLYVNKPIPPKSRVCLVGKTAIVTGANRGIGFEIALALAQRGCKVILACRSNGDQARDAIIAKTCNENVVSKHIDLASFDSVKEFAEEINQTEERLDILIHNAVLVGIPLTYTFDGLNPVMQINHFSPFLLTHLLIDLLKKSSPSRIIFVSSLMAFIHNLTLDNLNYPDEPTDWKLAIKLYSNCKLCNLITTLELSEKLQQFGISVNAVHPGLVSTSIVEQFRSIGTQDIFIYLANLLLLTPLSRSVDEGAYAVTEAATSPLYREVTGKFLYDRGTLPFPGLARDKEFCIQLWETSEDYVQLGLDDRL